MIKHIFFHTIGNTITFFLLDALLPTINFEGGFQSYLLAGIIIGILNVSLRPVLKIATFPLKILTLGLFVFVINLVMLYLVVVVINALNVQDIQISITGLQEYAITAIVFTFLSGIIHSLEK